MSGSWSVECYITDEEETGHAFGLYRSCLRAVDIDFVVDIVTVSQVFL